jgi:hypothetical protein
MLEWLEISSLPTSLTVVATTTRAFLHVPHALGSDPFQATMCGNGTLETTHWLLEGVIAAAGHAFPAPPGASSPALDSQEPVGLSAAHWAYRLSGYFHTTDATRRLLPVIARRFAESGRSTLAAWAEQKISEESGHEQLALRDLRELGYRAHELVGSCVPPRAAAWVALFERLASADDPAGCVGYAHALERLALLRGPAEVETIERGLPAGVNVTRCLRVHSAIGSDAHHVRSNVTTTAALNADERRAIAHACYATARIYFDPTLANDFQSGRLAAKIAAFRTQAQLNSLPATIDDNPTPNPN